MTASPAIGLGWLSNKVASIKDIDAWEAEDLAAVEAASKKAYDSYKQPIRQLQSQAVDLISDLINVSSQADALEQVKHDLTAITDPLKRDIAASIQRCLVIARAEALEEKENYPFAEKLENDTRAYYNSHLYSESAHSPLKVKVVPPIYKPNSPNLMGFEVLNAAFDAALKRDPRVIAFGEDVGHLGDVNQGFHGLQEKYGLLRVRIPASAKRPFWARPLAWRCAVCARSARSSTWIISFTHCRSQPMTWQRCAGEPLAPSRRR